jgi:tetratricopeptide (TPR) repeat protein
LQKGVVHFKQALEINPNNPDALNWICTLYSNAGQPEAAWPLVEKLLKIDPLTATNYVIPAWLNMLEGDFAQSLEISLKAYRMDPKNPPIRFVYCLLLVYNQCLEEAYSLFDEHYKEMPQHLWAQMGLCFKYALQGEKGKALQLMSDGLKKQARCDLFDSWVIAVCDALLGEKNEAIDSLETAVNLGAIYYPFFSKLDPLLKNIRGEERFKKLMQRVKTEWENFEV